ncbi:glycosyltransferase [Aquimarina sp. MMG016]|uniref:glycosyltransferase family 2 protein n=1 Tax=Aquimarina sp. MMG016 TaxID=2822690 RepID=UPI001B3A2D43|nr:glycosyltransferase [Aquimarina sp. MMG016]MBQ4820289.1 glycosyltransferase [Aquimarina sp. MMG016]
MKVSIAIITYNHEQFIKNTIEGILMQETDHSYEIVIGEDNSTDSTKEILLEYKKTYPDKFNLKIRDKNIGMMPNFIDTLKSCTGEYIALCEGDDYWTDPLKIQKQVDFLDTNPEYHICYHEAQVLENNKLREDTITRKVPNTSTINDIAQGNFMHTPTVMLRNNFEIPDWFFKTPLGDWSLYMISIKNKKAKKLADSMAVYRIHDSSVWSSKSDIKRLQGTINAIDLLTSSKLFDSDIVTILDNNKMIYKKDLEYILRKENKLKTKWKRIKTYFRDR